MLLPSGFFSSLRKRCQPRIIGAAAIAAMAVSPAAHAGGFNISLPLSASLFSDCLLSASPLSFGSVSGLAAGTDAQSTVTVACTLTTPYTLSMNAGTTAGATTSQRSLVATSGGSTYKLNYSISRNSAETQNWGMVVGTDTASGTGTGLPVSFTAYGHLSGNASSLVGLTYTDTITVTVNY